MKRNTLLTTAACILAFLSTGQLFAQDEAAPVMPAFETLTLVDAQTTASPYKGQFMLEIQHRFSEIKEIKDIFGIYGSANTRIGLSYGITDKLMVGFGTTRKNMLQDLEWKYAILTQTSKLPISLSYHGNAVLDARDQKFFGPEEDFQFAYRMSYLNELIISSRIGDKVSLQVVPTFVWFNAVPEGYSNANASINFGGRFQVLGFSSMYIQTWPLGWKLEPAPTHSGFSLPTMTTLSGIKILLLTPTIPGMVIFALGLTSQSGSKKNENSNNLFFNPPTGSNIHPRRTAR